MNFGVKFQMIRSVLWALVVGLCIQGCSTKNSVPWEEFNGRVHAVGNSCEDLKRNSAIRPAYPAEAKRNNQEGWVIAAFDVSPEGIPNNIRVVESYPVGVFEDSMLASIRNSRFAGTGVPRVGCIMPAKFLLQ